MTEGEYLAFVGWCYMAWLFGVVFPTAFIMDWHMRRRLKNRLDRAQ